MIKKLLIFSLLCTFPVSQTLLATENTGMPNKILFQELKAELVEQREKLESIDALGGGVIGLGQHRPMEPLVPNHLEYRDGSYKWVTPEVYEVVNHKWRTYYDAKAKEAAEKRAAKAKAFYAKHKKLAETTRIEYVVHPGPAGDVRIWRKLKKGKNKDAVEELLGKPENIAKEKTSQGKAELWYYPQGFVVFLNKKVTQWQAPLAKRVLIES